ncbi:pheromone-regulated protein PRM10 [Sugiyamaella lignohabitans]|uniref:Pheromone-regulated protein PRM10 n=1 Tax=Sugiyamaella lignohabitans TaxID=796027 RepID=A0A161HN48_9ASCO|nr:pheromone-regulated protein PRM10 [Sugiyamaella lignohabitans]ANB15477.1 pheromone-regulated protein PRM10 [Sugiyamaella lignohabitans]
MILISASGYVVTYFINKRLSGASQVSSAISAFVIGILGNVYSRVGHGLAFAAMLPGIFVIVPGGVASQGSLVSGIQVADDIVANRTELANQQAMATSAMSLGITMIQVCIGITVGLFVATLFIYPFGKKRSGLFTF